MRVATFNWASIERKTDESIKSGSGKEKKDKFLRDAKLKGGKKTKSGDLIVGAKDMQTAANAMIRLVKSNTAGWPDSVAANAASIAVSGGISPNLGGDTVVPLSFTDSLMRAGLWGGGLNSGEFPEENERYIPKTAKSKSDPAMHHGVNYSPAINIIAMFNAGWHAKNHMYGTWPSRGVYVKSRKDYDGDHYLEKAIEAFNGKYGGKYNCTAKLADIYKSRRQRGLAQYRYNSTTR